MTYLFTIDLLCSKPVKEKNPYEKERKKHVYKKQYTVYYTVYIVYVVFRSCGWF